MLWASQVAPGHGNELRIRVYGDQAGLSWAQEDPGYPALHAAGRGAAHDRPGQPGRRACSGAPDAASRTAARKGSSKASPISTAMPPS